MTLRSKMSGVVLLGQVVIASLVCCSSLAGAQAPQATNSGSAISTLNTPASAADLTLPVAQLKPEQIAAMQAKLADWPQLGRYRDENAKLGPPVADQQRVVFFGDSLTDAWGRRHGHFFPDMPWVNRGISGQTTPQMLVRFQQDVLSLQPRAVVILAGINDMAGNTGPETLSAIEDNLRSMAALAQAAHVRVVLCSVLPAAAIPWRAGVDPRAEEVALNNWMRQFAAQQKLAYLDYYTPLVGPDGGMRPGMSVDGLHPNDAGYAVMEPMARAAVTKALAGPER